MNSLARQRTALQNETQDSRCQSALSDAATHRPRRASRQRHFPRRRQQQRQRLSPRPRAASEGDKGRWQARLSCRPLRVRAASRRWRSSSCCKRSSPSFRLSISSPRRPDPNASGLRLTVAVGLDRIVMAGQHQHLAAFPSLSAQTTRRPRKSPCRTAPSDRMGGKVRVAFKVLGNFSPARVPPVLFRYRSAPKQDPS